MNKQLVASELNLKVLEVELVPGQEPDNSEDFVTDVYVTFELTGVDVARLLGVQYRALEKHAAKMTERQWLRSLQEGKYAATVLLALKPYVKKEVYQYCLDEFGERPRRLTVEWAETFDPSAHALQYDAKKELLRVAFEVSALAG